MVFHWSLGDSKSPQVSRPRLMILAIIIIIIIIIIIYLKQYSWVKIVCIW